MTATQSRVTCASRSSLGPDWSLLGLKLGACSVPGAVSIRGDRARFSGTCLQTPSLSVCSHLAWGTAGFGSLNSGVPRPPLLSKASVGPRQLWLLPVPMNTSHRNDQGPSFSPQRSASTSHQGSAHICYSSKIQGFIGCLGSFGWFLLGARLSWERECDWLHFIDEETEALERSHLLPKVTQWGRK